MSTRPNEIETERRLKQVEKRLSAAFPDAADSLVRREIRAMYAELLRRARFTDFVPLLVYRLARERLLEHQAAHIDESDIGGVAARSA
jgi:hypothetical protein